MRTIKFRGKPEYSDEKWVFGGYALAHGGDDEHQIIVPTDDRWGTKAYAVDPETVGQFTGLLDKNGKEIFEGDVIECTGSQNRPIRHVVKFNDERGGYSQYLFMGEGITIKPSDAGLLWQQYISEHEKYIIGNIHDNPQLLKPKK
jgi:uncharacterized phage protein (TIGR01671 family)